MNICYKTFLVYNSRSVLVHPNDELKICKVGLPWWSSDKGPEPDSALHCREPGFNPWSGSLDPTCWAAWPKNKNIKIKT